MNTFARGSKTGKRGCKTDKNGITQGKTDKSGPYLKFDKYLQPV